MNIQVKTTDGEYVVYEGVTRPSSQRGNREWLPVYGQHDGPDPALKGEHPPGTWAYWRVVPEESEPEAPRSVPGKSSVCKVCGETAWAPSWSCDCCDSKYGDMNVDRWKASHRRLLRVVEAARSRQINPGATYYVALTYALNDLTPEDQEAP